MILVLMSDGDELLMKGGYWKAGTGKVSDT